MPHDLTENRFLLLQAIGLKPLVNEPSFDPMLTKFYDAIWPWGQLVKSWLGGFCEGVL